jgi:lipoprotein-releasing system permease protein
VSRIGVASIALGLAVGIVSLSVLTGFKATIKNKIFVFGAHARISKISLNQSSDETPMLRSTVARLSDPNLYYTQAVTHKTAILKTTDELEGIIVKGIGPDFDTTQIKQHIVAGHFIDFKDATHTSQIVLSRKIANNLRLSVGGSVLLYVIQNPPRVRKMQVVGIYETQVEEFDNHLVMADMALVQHLNDWAADSVGAVELYVKNFAELNTTVRNINRQLPPDLRIEPVTNRFGGLFDWLQLLDRNTLIFLILILFVACFNIVAVLLVMMIERTPMIGLLKTLGSPKTQIQQIFFYIGLRLLFLGITLGNVIGLGVCWVQQQFKIIPLNPASYYMAHVPIQFDWTAIAWLNIGAFILISLILLLPTLVISRIEPLQALIFKK